MSRFRTATATTALVATVAALAVASASTPAQAVATYTPGGKACVASAQVSPNSAQASSANRILQLAQRSANETASAFSTQMVQINSQWRSSSEVRSRLRARAAELGVADPYYQQIDNAERVAEQRVLEMRQTHGVVQTHQTSQVHMQVAYAAFYTQVATDATKAGQQRCADAVSAAATAYDQTVSLSDQIYTVALANAEAQKNENLAIVATLPKAEAKTLLPQILERYQVATAWASETHRQATSTAFRVFSEVLPAAAAASR